MATGAYTVPVPPAMLSFIFRPRKKFSLENLKYLYGQLVKNLVVTKKNQNTIVEVLRQIAELMIWGDKHNSSFFDFFCEKNILKHCIEILGQPCEKSVKVQVIQSLSILLQNTHSETAVFYLLSNNYINDLIVHKFDFSDEGLLAYYISFLKTLSLKLNPQTIQFFFNEKAQDFPLYTEAIKFFNHNEQMVRIAVRTLTLNVYRVNYEPCQIFILDRSAVPYFSNLVHYIVDQAVNIQKLMDASTYLNSRKVNESVANQIDLYYYIQDIFDLGKDLKKDALGNTLMDQLLAHFILPVLIASLLPPDVRRTSKRKLMLSPKLALFLLAQVFLVFRHEGFVNAIATCLIHKQPPLLCKWLMHAIPNHPIKSPVPLTTLLFALSRGRKRKSKNVHIEMDTKPDDSSTSDALSETKRETKRRRDLPRDMNLNARSYMPEVGPVLNPVTACPNHNEPLPTNEVRTALFAMMRQKDESLLYGVVTVLVSLLKNPAINKELLVAGGICPQQHYHTRRLLHELTSDDTGNDHGGFDSDRDDNDMEDSIVKKPLGLEDFKVLNKDAINLLLQRRQVDTGSEQTTPRAPDTAPPAPPPTFELDAKNNKNIISAADSKTPPPQPKEVKEEGKDEIEGKEKDLKAEDIFPIPNSGAGKEKESGSVQGEQEMIEDSDRLQEPQSSEGPRDEANKSDLEQEHLEEEDNTNTVIPTAVSGEAETEKKKQVPLARESKLTGVIPKEETKNPLNYCREVVESLVSALATQPPYRLVTVQMVIDLLGEMVLDNTPNPCLNEIDIPKLERAYQLAAKDVAKRFTKKEDHEALLNNFQTCYKDMSKPIDIEELLTNAVTLLPVARNAMSGIPLQFRRPSGKMEAAKKSIQVYLLLRGLRYKLLKINDSNFPLTKAYSEEQQIRKKQQIKISDQDAIPCVIVVGKRRERHFLVVHRTLLLVVQHHPTRAGYALVKVVVPLRNQEVKEVDEASTPASLTVVLRIGIKPHPSARLQSLGVWALTLFFENVEDCNNANQHLNFSRERARVKLVKQLIISLSNDRDDEKEDSDDDSAV
uniref:FPL domain-containing protein n=2 Tax=Amorphochlora amoebiformis TaxID=1561963 RepID=A0A7S0H9W9_9EUKA